MHLIPLVEYVLFFSITISALFVDADIETGFETCKEDEWVCNPSRRCIPNHWKCDGTPDCEDASDEPPSCNVGAVCKVSQFMCKKSKKCIPQIWVCDGTPDCSRYATSDSSDEDHLRCGFENCPWNKVRCGNSSECIHIAEFCDGTPQCNNSFDEGNFCDAKKCSTMGCDYKCSETPLGPMCYCPQGFLVHNSTNCFDSNECEIDGICDQKCENTVQSFHCSCVSGYKLTGKGTCNAINVPESEEATLLFISAKGIHKLKLTGEEIEYSHKDMTESRYSMSLEVDHRNRSLCFVQANATSESSYASITCQNIDNPSNSWTLPDSHNFKLSFMTIISLDWVSGNWYLLDLSREIIYLCTSDMSRCLILIDVGLNRVRGFALDPTTGFMFFTKWGTQFPSLDRVLLDGSERIELVNKSIVYPYGLTADLANQHIYWIDTYLDSLERIDYDGQNRKVIIKGQPVEHLFDITVFENNLYISSWMNYSISKFNKFGKEDFKVIANTSRSISLHVFHRQRQPEVAHPCKSNNGGCEHICITLWKGGIAYPACHCQVGYKLFGERKCHKVEFDTFLVYGQSGGIIKGLSLVEGKRTEKQIMLPIFVMLDPVSLDTDVASKHIYFSDSQHSTTIWRVAINWENKPEKFLSVGEKARVSGLAVDWLGRNLYWTDSARGTISVAKLSDPSIRTNIVVETRKHYKSIALNPEKGLMFWSQWDYNYNVDNEENSGIWMAWMDGTTRKSLVSKRLLWPNGLTLDTLTNTLYWCDFFLNTIESVNIDNPSQREKLFQGDEVQNPYGLTYFEDFLYWTEHHQPTVRRMNLSDSNHTIVTMSNENKNLFELKIYDSTFTDSKIGLKSRCEGCSERNLCIPIPGGRKCLNVSELSINLINESTNSTGECLDGFFDCVLPSKSGEFCIAMDYVCDGVKHCSNGTDEDTSPDGPCANFTCKEGMFQCDGTTCLDKAEVCDNLVDCLDGADEASCESSKCLETQFKCTSGRCIPADWVCDSDPDCGHNDTSDEGPNCNYTTSTRDDSLIQVATNDVECSIYGFHCKNRRCISYKYVCDGENDCSDNSDETDCPPDMCKAPYQFTCRYENGSLAGCIPVSQWCDGKNDCPLATDEKLCPPPCGQKEFRCYGKPHFCYPISYRCDGKVDCELGEDESGCECDRAMGHGNLNDKFQCDQSTCIDWEKTCDGVKDCPMGQDEGPFCPGKENKMSVLNCDHPNRLCDNGTLCISVQDLCDGKTHCKDGSDEGLLCGENQCGISLSCTHYCHNAPEGVVCWCPAHLYLQNDHITCLSTHPCSGWGTCSQRCLQIGNRHKCECNEGYTLQPDGFTCKTNDGGVPLVIYSNRHELRGVDLRTLSVKPLISSLKNTIAIDFLHNSTTDLIFWTDVIDDKIYKGTLIGGSIGNIEVVVQTGLATAEGLAVDWIGLNLYWVESNLDQIEVAKINGSFRRTLVAGDMESPRAIAIDPRYGLLFWSDWDTNAPRIERCSLAGDSRITVVNIDRVSDGAWPNGLTLDYQLERIYWIDARSDSIHTVKYDGSGHHMVMQGHETLSHPFSISLFEGHVYWTDWRTNSVVRANKWNGTQIQVLQRSLTQPFDIQILHPSRQPKAKYNPCGYNNGNCSHLCLLSLNSTRKCDCPHVMRLAEDNMTCIVNEKVLVISRLNEIRGVDLYQPYYHTIPAISLPHTQTPVQMDYVASTKEIYWAEAHTFEVKKTPLTGGTIQTVLDTGIEQPFGFAIDWISGNMFIGCASSNSIKIVAATLQGEFLTTVYNSPAQNVSEQPSQGRIIKCLVVDPFRGQMIWSEWEKNVSSSLIRANMDGTNVTTLFTSPNKTSSAITSLSMDYKTNFIYWVNSGPNPSIQWLDLHTSSETLFLKNRKGASPLAATLYKDLVYYSDQNSQAIYSCSAVSGSDHTLVRNNTGIVNSIKIYDPMAQSGINLCSKNRGNCSHLCLPVSRTERVCACATGYVRDPKNYTNCIGTEEFVVYSINWEMRGLALDTNDSSVLGPIQRVSMATSIDFHSGQDYLYWGDSEHGTITRIHRDGTGRQVVIGHLENADVSHVTSDWFSGLAVDWIADNIYWTDMKHKAIEVSRTNGSCQYVVIHEGLDSPGSVAVDPPRGLIFWADRGKDGSLSSALLDGTNRSYVIPPPYPGQITDIALHYTEMKVYWCDANSNIIGRVNYNGSNIETILNHSMSSPFAIAIHGNKIYWIDVSKDKGSLSMMDLKMRKPKVVLSGLGDSLKDILVFSPSRENMGTNPCANDNGGCKELCLFNGKDPVCVCSHGKVAPDGKSCEDYDALLMYSAISRIESVHLTDASNLNAPHPPIYSRELMRNAIGLSYDYFSNTLFYSDIQKGSINAVHFNGTNHRVLLQRQGSVEGLAYQSSSNILFWTCNNDATIYSANLSERVLTPKTVIKLGVNDKPRGIVVESCHGHMYWTNWNSQHPGIHRAFTSGFQQEAIITTDIKMPNAIALDEPEAKLYWGDARLDKIERCDLSGNHRIILASAKAEHIFSMAVYGEFIFWTDWVQHAILRANKYTGQDLVWLRRDISRPMGIVAIANISHECVVNGCNVLNGGCTDVCEPDENGHPLCTCTPGRKLNVDLRTCSPILPPGENRSCARDFVCSNGGCIPYHLTCDGVDHCADGSDEKISYCATRTCMDGYFRCYSNRCIPNSQLCDGENHCGDNADEANCTCSSETHFKCASGKCIPLKFRCDVDPDCQDASDEMDCPVKDCLGGPQKDLIHCNHTTACIHPLWICDGQDDCWDNSDEENCPPSTSSKPGTTDSKCPSTNFACDSGQCIKLSWKCDGEEDCNDGSDEKNCQYVCRSDQFQCKNMDCIPVSWVCDGSPDCPDESDESQHCQFECKDYQFRCNSTGRCIPDSWRCDGIGDCLDKSDEANCSLGICKHHDHFQCANNYLCLIKEFYCDGDDDCGDNSDEPEGCSSHVMAPAGAKSCGAGYLKCANSRCIRLDLACNDKDDCGDNSDELPLNYACFGNITCGKDEFKCANKLCVNNTQVCDGTNDCGDFSDENRCNINECLEKVCRHECVDLPIGYRCECPPGFRSHSHGSLCIDIDECSELSPCSQICNNTHGSYKCSCNPGYELHNHTCKHNSNEKPELLFSNRYYIRKLSISGESNIFIRNLTNSVALDFDWIEKCIYWSDVTVFRSSIKRWCPGFTSHHVIHSATLQNPDGLAVDWVGRNLYWCDKGLDTIEVSHLNGSFRKVLIKNNLSEPRAIALHPHKGLMFWSDWGEEAHIGKAGMDGSDQTRIVYTNLGWPNALTIDYETDMLYWADAREDYIARSDLLGNNVVHILNREINPNLKLHHVFAITVWEDYIYWTDWETMTVERCNRLTKGDCKSMIDLVHRPMDIRLYHQYRQKPMWNNPCEDGGGCPTLCLLAPGGTKVCACPENFIEVHDPTPSCRPNCTSSQFQCENSYKCIPFWWKCDTQDDCGDGSDEPDTCRKFECHPGQFQCPNLKCIHPSQLCNGVDDCQDGSDELNCNQHTCLETQFKCKGDGNQSDVCISITKKCDGIPDCIKQEDEAGCSPKTCPPNQMMCEDIKHCIPSVWACDGASDCGKSGWDESPELCLKRECSEGMFRCSTGRCIPLTWKCDGTRDCPKGEDEPESCLTTSCQPTYFKCDNNKCLPGRWKCDFEDDCGDNSDEINCIPRNCSESEFRCNNNRCIPGGLRCDGEENCMDGSDEENCNKTCNEQEFMCTKPKQCIYEKLRCDGDVDCADGSDEAGCDNSCPLPGYWRCHEGGPCNPPHWTCDNDPDCADSSDEAEALCKVTVCSPYRFRCSNHKCIQSSLVCDGQDSCGDNSDETFEACELQKACPSNGFRCRNGHCISKENVCDGFNDCIDNWDEHNCPVHNCTALKCSQLCLPKHDFRGHKCACDHGYISVNESSCIAIEGDTGMLAVVSESGVHQIDTQKWIQSGQLKKINNYFTVRGGGGRAADVAVINRDLVLYAAQQSNIIASSIFSNSSTTDVKTIVKEMGDVVGLSVDWIGKRIYYAHDLSMRITVTTLKGKMQKTIARTEHSHPLDIVVCPQKGEVYWSEGSDVSRIMVGRTDGAGKDILVKGGLSYPSGLAIDHPAQRLYWSDLKQRAIYYVHLSGPLSKQPGDSNDPQRTLVFKGINSMKPHKIDVFSEYLFFSLWSQPGVISVDKLGRNDRQIRYGYEGIATQLVYLHSHKFANMSSPCSGNPCHQSALCLIAHGGANYTCVCPDSGVPYQNETSNQLECLKPGCPLECLAGGTCYLTNDGPRCACAPLYGGPRCNIYLCANRCKNNGICYADEPSVTPSFEPPALKCKCVGDWTGYDCSIRKDVEKETCTNPCLNGGICKVGPGSNHPACFCPHGFSGTWCEYCMDRECKHGICYRDANGQLACNCTAGFKGPHCSEIDCDNYCVKGHCTKSDEGPVCKCPSGFAGKRCDRDLCAGLCHNSGKCVADSSNEVRCACPEAWSGEHCEVDLCLCHCGDPGCPCGLPKPSACNRPLDICHPHKCNNNSTCVIVGSQPVCRCKPGWAGTECEVETPYPNACTGYCRHGGVCTLVGNITYCYCPSGWRGLRCEENISCKNFCFNGGTCTKPVSDDMAPTCKCIPGYDGKRCQTPVHFTPEVSGVSEQGTDDQSNDQWDIQPLRILFATISFLLLLLVAGGVTYCVVIQKRRRPFSHVRMMENVEISNPMYQPGQLINDDNIATDFSIEQQDNSNFGNPVYESVYNCGGGMKEEERRGLLGLDDQQSNDL